MTSRERVTECPPQAGRGLTICTVGGRNLVFSEQDQAIHELDDLTACVWRAVDHGVATDALIDELAQQGLSRDEAANAVNLRLQSRQSLDTPADVSRARGASPEPLQWLPITVAGVSIALHLSPELLADVDPVIGHLRTGATHSDFQLSARLEVDEVSVLPAGGPAWACARDAFVPLLKGELIQFVLDAERHEIALHAAALAKGDELILLLGSPGAGKSTLAIALTKAGYRLVADDVVLVGPESAVTGLAFPFAVKAGSWPLLAEHWPELAPGPVYRRPDEQEVRFVLTQSWAESPPDRITRIILLDRQPEGDAQLLDLDPVDALAALIAEGDAPGDRLTSAAFSALARMVETAGCNRLVYADAPAAADLLGRT